MIDLRPYIPTVLQKFSFGQGMPPYMFQGRLVRFERRKEITLTPNTHWGLRRLFQCIILCSLYHCYMLSQYYRSVSLTMNSPNIWNIKIAFIRTEIESHNKILSKVNWHSGSSDCSSLLYIGNALFWITTIPFERCQLSILILYIFRFLRYFVLFIIFLFSHSAYVIHYFIFWANCVSVFYFLFYYDPRTMWPTIVVLSVHGNRFYFND